MAFASTGSFRSRVRRFPCKALELSRRFLFALNTPLANRVRSHLERGEHQALIDIEIDPANYHDSERFRDDYLAVSLLSKYPSFNLGIDTAQVAMEKFVSAEQQCAHVNESLPSQLVVASTTTTLASYIHMARVNIANCLGDFSWDAAEEFFAFSHGASTRLTRRRGDPFYKFSGKPEVTVDARDLAVCAISRIPLWRENLESEFGPNPYDWVKPVIGNRVTTVPKNAKTDRIIAIEPCMNMFLQKGIGALIRKRLRTVSIDLNDQSINQDLAAAAYSRKYATIDLKAASDTISIEIVRALLPDDWFDAVFQTRCSRGVLPDGTVHLYQKVSSMGNGFTFELESLIFWALSRAVIQLGGYEDVLGVYGDDIVVHQDAAHHLIWLLSECGFATNLEKTFLKGSFFESCGKHYFQGMDVTPVYIRKPVCDDFRLIWLANSFRRYAGRFLGTVSDCRFRLPIQAVVSELPLHLRQPRLPDGVGDGALIGSWDEVRPRFSMRTGTYSAKVLEPRTRKTRPNGFAGLLSFWQTLPEFPITYVTGWGGSNQMMIPSREGVIGLEVATGTGTELQLTSTSNEYRFATVQVGAWGDLPIWDCHL